MVRNNTKSGRLMKRNKTNRCLVEVVTVVFMLCPSLSGLYAQDPLPPIARVLEPLHLPGQTKEMHSSGRLIVCHDSLPDNFKHTADNVIEDGTRSLLVVSWKVISVLRLFIPIV